MTPTFEQYLQKYADIIIRIGLNLRAGQRLIVSAPVQSAPLVQKIAISAYQAGCRYVDAIYQDEKSNLRILSVLPEFLAKHARNVVKRWFYNYFLRDVSIASLELVAGTFLMLFGLVYGGYHWWHSYNANVPTATGTVVLSAVAVLGGLQLLLSFLNYDIASVPRQPIHRSLELHAVATPATPRAAPGEGS
jgi:hypothetical protein